MSTVTEKLLMYALGRNVQYFDEPAVRAIVRESAASNYTFASLVWASCRARRSRCGARAGAGAEEALQFTP